MDGEPAKVSIYVLTRGDPRVETVGSLYALLSHERVAHLEWHPGLYVHHSRSEAATDFTAHPERGDILMFIDDDMGFTVAAFETVLAAIDSGKRIAGGIYWSPNKFSDDPTNDLFPVVFKLNSGKRGTQYVDTWVHEPYPRGWTARQTEPFICDAIGTGFLMIRRDVFAEMKPHHPGPLHYFDFDVIGGVATGEDITFCWRAQQIGIPTWAVPLPDRDDLFHVKTFRARRPDLAILEA